jgi:3'-phosphoadenosine 5'-phosphosulfate sulfotransferase (PAPS reductase)/FAD synthetase
MNAIQISGGVDSLALLWRLKPQWQDSVVMWVDGGASYPETRRWMERIADLVPHFYTVAGRQPRVIAEYGYPADVVPVKYSRQGDLLYGKQPVRYQSYFDCCARSLWWPLSCACVALGINTVYRGQRKDERRKAPIADGYIDDMGITYRFPIQDWTKEEVFAYVRENCSELMPPYYALGELTSRDCWNCTAYLDENGPRIRNLPPERRQVVEERIAQWKQHVAEEMSHGLR